MVWNAISLQHDVASTAGQIDFTTFIGPVVSKIFKSSCSTQFNRAIKSSCLAYHLMRFLSGVLEIFLAGKTFENGIIQHIDHKPVWYVTRNKILTAVRTRVIIFGPVVDAFFAIQLVTFTAFHQLR